MAKTVFVKIVQIFVFFVLLLACLILAGKVLTPKWMGEKSNNVTMICRGLYAEKDHSLDVLFLGSSNVYRGVAPMELYRDHGIAAYNYATPGSRIWISYYLLCDALRSQKPQVVFLDIDAAFFSTDAMTPNYYKAFNNMEFSRVKMRAMQDKNIRAHAFQILFPAIAYHNRATKLEKNDIRCAFAPNHYALKGMAVNAGVQPYTDGNYMVEKNTVSQIAPKEKPYLDQIIALCEENDITLVLTELPSTHTWNMTKHRLMQAYAEENHLDFLDFNMMIDKLGIDWNTDTQDSGYHMNLSGAQKCTKFIGEYLSEHFTLPDHRGDSSYAQWSYDLTEYQQVVKEAQQTLKNPNVRAKKKRNHTQSQ